MSNNQKNSEPISSPRLLLALQSLSRILGRSMVDMLIADLERQGITLHGDAKYPMKQVERALTATFGSEGGVLLAEKLRRSLDLQ
ncbi:MAG: hypothetical protein ABI347_10670 [Nitrososphaera sp.]